MYWFKTVSRDEALTVTAEYESYKVHYSRGHSQYVLIRFKNHEQLDFDKYCATDDVIDMVDSILPGNEVNMLVHPNSDTILEMEANGGYILRFEESMKRLKSGRTGYYFVGGFMYLLFIYGLFSLIYERNQNRRHKKSTG
ncbi:MAG: hypothetical protein IJL71_01445 [Oscillospiraceae bacterium]|nr:hypothetical protein [Oscillospiraceae bacterium]